MVKLIGFYSRPLRGTAERPDGHHLADDGLVEGRQRGVQSDPICPGQCHLRVNLRPGRAQH